MDTPPSPIEPGQVHEFHIELRATSNVWRTGHRLRVTVASAFWPTWARNPNTNAATGDNEVVRVAVNTVHHSRTQPSRLIAPVVPRAGEQAAPATS